MSILIIGSNGSLGSQLMKVFPDAEGWDMPNIDLLCPGDWRRRVLDLKPSLIINAAAYNDVEACEKITAECRKAIMLNFNLPAHLCAIANELEASLVHYSTNYVFDGKKPMGYSELDIPNPLNVYGRTKLMGEGALSRRFYNARVRTYVIRTSKLFGPIGAGGYSKSSFVDQLVNRLKESGAAEVVDGEKSSFTYTPDLAEATKELIKSPRSGIYHLVNSRAATWLEMAREILHYLSGRYSITAVPSDFYPRAAKRPEYSQLLNTRFRPLRPWQDALAEYLSKNNLE